MKKTSLIIATLFFCQFHLLQAQDKKCTYTYNPQKTKLEWTAYKFTERTGVKGSFKEIRVDGDKKNAPSIQQAMKKSNFRITPFSVDSNHPDRDSKIKKYFFGDSGQTIQGDFSAIRGGSKGTARMHLSLNGTTKIVPVAFEIQKGNLLTVTGKLSVKDFGMKGKLKKLNEVCEDLHKGKDGKSILWPDVTFRIESEFDAICK